MTKLRLWQLDQYNRVLFLDVDSVLTGPLDGVFEATGAALAHAVPHPESPLGEQTESAIPDKYLMASTPEIKRRHVFPPSDEDFRHGPDYFNAGFYVFSSSNILHVHYKSLTSNTTKPKFKSGCPEQNLLNYAHRRNGPMDPCPGRHSNQNGTFFWRLRMMWRWVQ
ncbi:glycosyltransferase family 8 protein [Periconia macrospinosa]|uniref:Glycosyltransferase family 8 protein n=1 Tax=Periconia macrospinosa TaxID=97972 RepID=A0A2V1E1A1_9PLEO|nr:glycosyltransferase family 8 protein [Periconia macrospinosa]